MPASSHQILTQVFIANADRITYRLRASFPSMCHSHAEDAVSAAYVDVLVRPEVFIDAYERGGERLLLSLFTKVAWRRLRGQWRRKSFTAEQPMESLPEQRGVSDPEQELMAAHLSRRLDHLIDRAAIAFGGRQDAVLRDALRDKMTTGDPDSHLAERHHVPREYINRAKRWIQSEIAAAA